MPPPSARARRGWRRVAARLEPAAPGRRVRALGPPLPVAAAHPYSLWSGLQSGLWSGLQSGEPSGDEEPSRSAAGRTRWTPRRQSRASRGQTWRGGTMRSCSRFAPFDCQCFRSGTSADVKRSTPLQLVHPPRRNSRFTRDHRRVNSSSSANHSRHTPPADSITSSNPEFSRQVRASHTGIHRNDETATASTATSGLTHRAAKCVHDFRIVIAEVFQGLAGEWPKRSCTEAIQTARQFYQPGRIAYWPAAARHAGSPPTTGSENTHSGVETVIRVPGGGRRVKSRSLASSTRPTREPAAKTRSCGCSSTVKS